MKDESMNVASLTSTTTSSFSATSGLNKRPSSSLLVRSCSPLHSTTATRVEDEALPGQAKQGIRGSLVVIISD